MGILQKSAKHVMILGGSRIAQYLAEELIRSENSVKIIEKNEARCDELCGTLPGNALVICGDGSDHGLLTEEGLDRADAFVALTGMDEENLLVSYYALGRRVPKVISRLTMSPSPRPSTALPRMSESISSVDTLPLSPRA